MTLVDTGGVGAANVVGVALVLIATFAALHGVSGVALATVAVALVLTC